MRFHFKKLHHLIRYFVILGIISFCGYVMQWQNSIFLALNAPPIYLACEFKKRILPLINIISPAQTTEFYVFLLPITIVYFGVIGFFLKQLWNEHGFIRLVSLFGFVLFVIYIHWLTWQNLLFYLAAS